MAMAHACWQQLACRQRGSVRCSPAMRRELMRSIPCAPPTAHGVALPCDGATCMHPCWVLRMGGCATRWTVSRATRSAVFAGTALHLALDGNSYVFTEVSAFPDADARKDASKARSPVAGKVTRVLVAAGASRASGVNNWSACEAMKMEMWLCSEAAGRGAGRARARGRARWTAGALLVELEITLRRKHENGQSHIDLRADRRADQPASNTLCPLRPRRWQPRRAMPSTPELQRHARAPAQPGGRHGPPAVSWDPEVMAAVVDAIREACPGVIINLTTGVVGKDISGPMACIRRVKPEIAACNAGSLNYLKIKDRRPMGLAAHGVRQPGGQGAAVSGCDARVRHAPRVRML